MNHSAIADEHIAHTHRHITSQTNEFTVFIPRPMYTWHEGITLFSKPIMSALPAD